MRRLEWDAYMARSNRDNGVLNWMPYYVDHSVLL